MHHCVTLRLASPAIQPKDKKADPSLHSGFLRRSSDFQLTIVNILQCILSSVRITISKEDYLKAILEAEAEGEHVISATLKKWLSVSAPAVTMALRRLKR